MGNGTVLWSLVNCNLSAAMCCCMFCIVLRFVFKIQFVKSELENCVLLHVCSCGNWMLWVDFVFAVDS